MVFKILLINSILQNFTEIGPSLASETDVSNKSPFNTFLASPCTSFHFQYTNPSGISKIIQGLKPKSNADYDNLSSKGLKDIADLVSTSSSIIINQSLCSGTFSSKLKMIRWFLCLKRVTFKYWEIIARFLYCHQSRKCLRKRHMASLMYISQLICFSLTVITVFENITQPNLLRLN